MVIAGTVACSQDFILHGHYIESVKPRGPERHIPDTVLVELVTGAELFISEMLGPDPI